MAPITNAFIKSLRLRLGVTQPSFAKTIGISQAYLSMVEAGQRELTERMRARIAYEYRISIEKQIKAIELELKELKRFRNKKANKRL